MLNYIYIINFSIIIFKMEINEMSRNSSTLMALSWKEY